MLGPKETRTGEELRKLYISSDYKPRFNAPLKWHTCEKKTLRSEDTEESSCDYEDKTSYFHSQWQ
jgi:hypothetical protein